MSNGACNGHGYVVYIASAYHGRHGSILLLIYFTKYDY